jgi:epsilon-lactone hydrolase
MANWRVRLLVWILKVTVKRKMRGDPDVANIRRTLGAGGFAPPRDVTFTPGVVGGVSGEWVQGADVGPITMIYVHGGAFIACSPRTHRSVTGAFAKRGFRVFAPDYRLAPENKYPAALDDVEAVYNDLLAQGIPVARIVTAGESAGGNLVLSLLHRLRQNNIALPAATAAWSPVTDLTGSSESLQMNAEKEAMLDSRRIMHMRSFYLPEGVDPTLATLSPLFGDFTGMPPILVHVGQDEILRDDGVRVADKARSDGVDVEFKLWPLVPHAWQVFPMLPEARQSIDETSAFLRRHASVAI